MKRFLTLIKAATVSGVTFAGVNAAAQSSDFKNQSFQSDTQARLTVTVPFGAQTKTQKLEPRLELEIRNYQQRSVSHRDISWAVEDRVYKEANFGFTLSDNPQFIVNQRTLNLSDERANLDKISSTALITVGVGLAVIGLGVLIATTHSG